VPPPQFFVNSTVLRFFRHIFSIPLGEVPSNVTRYCGRRLHRSSFRFKEPTVAAGHSAQVSHAMAVNMIHKVVRYLAKRVNVFRRIETKRRRNSSSIYFSAAWTWCCIAMNRHDGPKTGSHISLRTESPCISTSLSASGFTTQYWLLYLILYPFCHYVIRTINLCPN